MKFEVLAILCVSLAACEKHPQTARQKPPSQPQTATHSRKTTIPDFSSLGAAQQNLARLHLQEGEPGKATAYLLESLKNHPSEITEQLLDEISSKSGFPVPTYELRHPYPVADVVGNRSESVFVALGGKYPTVVRWDLKPRPLIGAILFPTKADTIGPLRLSPDSRYLLVSRGDTNLLCSAATLKPIANLGGLPQIPDSSTLQTFSANSLLLANPISDGKTITWNIRDTATGEILRRETLSAFPKPVSAIFDQTVLKITLENRQRLSIPLRGDVEHDTIAFHHLSPLPSSPFSISENTVTHLIRLKLPGKAPERLLSAACGFRIDPSSQLPEAIPAPDRLNELQGIEGKNLPESYTIYTADDAIRHRLAAAFPHDFPQISSAVLAHEEIVKRTFASGDSKAIRAVIESAPEGLPLATALYLALEKQDAQLIDLCIHYAKQLPPALEVLARQPFNPGAVDYRKIPFENDLYPYESPDFSPIFSKLIQQKSADLASMKLPEGAAEEEIQEFVAELLDRENLIKLGKPNLAASALAAAEKLSADTGHAGASLQLAEIAGRYGALRSAVLRVQAIAHTSLGDYPAAHRAWIDLISQEHESEHFSTDYAEAAYTAFENGDPRQAIEILNTGIFRFPNDPLFAIRAGWIALLTDHPTEGLDYLEKAVKLGLPPAEIENTTALLAIAYTQGGEIEKAYGYLEQLKAITPEWADPATIEKLPWPEPLKASLRQLIWQP
ncbi:hypothetical protein ACFSSA_15350 [Luteolibacter algae]|uniref:Tetratricopeptide repeat protein n=1 Tax=Luteolibacter algae TaxID=454151 RepID=A0ABW5DBE2_9BACT